ncbi:hypothetical protein MVEN_00952100 [Mycena venus]|uniref:Uncharacterized protein n=1 Tax=Mycena venus TaxID=2733690 RepID=A0A8H6YBR4_9AGAR|nr:hypothetical protein MVEN_00952100 [Mycena venus]
MVLDEYSVIYKSRAGKRAPNRPPRFSSRRPIHDLSRFLGREFLTMRHGHGLLALVLKLYLVLFIAQAAFAERSGSDGSKSSSSGLSSSSKPSDTSLSSTSISSQSISSPKPSPSTTPFSSSSIPGSSSGSFSSNIPSSVYSTDTTSSTSIPTSPDPTPHNEMSSTSSNPTSAEPTASDPTSGDFSSTASPSSTNAVLASSRTSNKQVPIIAGVVAPVVAIILVAIAFVLYKRRQRANDRREWERTHEAIADAVRQVGSPVPGRSITPYAGSGAWSHMDLSAKGSGDTVTDPFTERPVAHQSAEYAALPVFRAVHSPDIQGCALPYAFPDVFFLPCAGRVRA